MFASSFRRSGTGLALSAVVVLAGCEKPEPLASTTGSISDLVTNVAVRGGSVPGLLVDGAVPTGTLGPVATVAGITAAVNGGSAAMDVHGSDVYTRLLISSLPTIGDDRARHGIPGRPPSLWGELHGCRFADRCPLATDTCRAQEPPLVEHQPGHFAACHYAGADLPTARVQ